MSLKEIGEFGFIRRVSQGCVFRPERVRKGIGDDAAAFTVDPGQVTLLTTDLLVERVHFILQRLTGFDLGHKALAVNLSDIAAMGGAAHEAFVSLAIPEHVSLEYLDDLYEGMKHLAAEHGVNILGGDTTGSRQDLVISIAVTGQVAEDEILFRHTAQSGDRIFVTGCLGDSRAGLHMILRDSPLTSGALQALVDAHLKPRPHLREGRFLAQAGGVRAAIDVSDGISSDLGHIAEESGLGARIWADKLPISRELQAYCGQSGLDPVDVALAGGEDYVLACTVDPQRADRLAEQYLDAFGTPLHMIGEMNDSGRLELVTHDGRIVPLKSTGWNHFHSGRDGGR